MGEIINKISFNGTSYDISIPHGTVNELHEASGNYLVSVPSLPSIGQMITITFNIPLDGSYVAFQTDTEVSSSMAITYKNRIIGLGYSETHIITTGSTYLFVVTEDPNDPENQRTVLSLIGGIDEFMGSHASERKSYGVGTTNMYGHVKISNGDVATVTSTDGLAAGMDHSHSNYSTTGHTHDYLPSSGGIMSGDVDMSGNEIKNTNFELVESLPTENLYEGRQVTYDGKIYTYHNEKWISTADDLGDLKEILPSEFIFRPTADTHSIKDEFASVKSIKGNTVVWNQLSSTVINYNDNGITQTQNEDGTFTLNGTAIHDVQIYSRDISIPDGHKGLFIFKHLSGEFDGILVFKYGSVVLSIPTTTNITTDNGLVCNIIEGCIINNATFSFQLFDLTQMFGEGNEPTSVEEFEKLYSHLPTDYNEGSLLNLNADSIKSVGFNQFNKNNIKINTALNTDGTEYTNTIRATSSFFRVLPNTAYYIKGIPDASKLNSVFLYDVNKNVLRYLTAPRVTDGDANLDGKLLFTTTNDEYYIRICFTKGNENNVCLNFSYTGERNGEYEPYEEHIVNLPIKEYFPDGMKSAGTAYDEIVFDKNIGKYKAIQRIGSVDMGTLTWSIQHISDNYPYGYVLTRSLTNRKLANNNVLSINYTNSLAETFTKDKKIIINNRNIDLYITDSSLNQYTSSQVKEQLQGQILYYELETPIETIIEDCDLIAYKANDWGTEEVLSEEPTTPIKADIEYNFDTVEMVRDNYFEVDKIKKDLNDIKSNIESDELVTTSQLSSYKRTFYLSSVTTTEEVDVDEDDIRVNSILFQVNDELSYEPENGDVLIFPMTTQSGSYRPGEGYYILSYVLIITTPSGARTFSFSDASRTKFNMGVVDYNLICVVENNYYLRLLNPVECMSALSAYRANEADSLSKRLYIDGFAFNSRSNVSHYGVCTAVANTAIKNVSIPGLTAITGAIARVKFANAHTVTSTSIADKARLMLNYAEYSTENDVGVIRNLSTGVCLPSTQSWAPGQILEMIYDGTYWNIISPYITHSGLSSLPTGSTS